MSENYRHVCTILLYHSAVEDWILIGQKVLDVFSITAAVSDSISANRRFL